MAVSFNLILFYHCSNYYFKKWIFLIALHCTAFIWVCDWRSILWSKGYNKFVGPSCWRWKWIQLVSNMGRHWWRWKYHWSWLAGILSHNMLFLSLHFHFNLFNHFNVHSYFIYLIAIYYRYTSIIMLVFHFWGITQLPVP